ncbi:MAG: beta-ketothiolase BktB [Chloroflexi bacterium]|nr:beta-ketothiolase BktB [Chloroflexota bacterium]
MEEVIIASGARTAIGTYGGSLRDVPATTLGSIAVKEALRRAGIAGDQVEHTIFGNVIHSSTDDMYISRVVAVNAGIPIGVPAFTVNRLCGSGMQAIISGVQSIISGDAQVVVAGGAESMSRGPYWIDKARWGYRLGNETLIDPVVGGVTDPFNKIHMGITAENVAEQYGITRQEQDEFALESQQKAVKAIQEGLFKEQIVPVELPSRKGTPNIFDTDEHPRADTSREKLASLKPAFKPDGTVTAGNASGLNDGAAAVVLMSRAKAESLGVAPMATIVSYGTAGVDPKYMGIGPIPAVDRALGRADLKMEQMDIIELNEAFAAQALAVARDLKMDSSKLNVNGGAIAMGHPIGATGALLTVKAIYELARRQATYGLITMCIGGGQGIAAILKR